MNLSASRGTPAHETCTVLIFKDREDEALLRRIRGEYGEMPGMRLTEDQAMRLWALDRPTCRRVLDALVASHYLEQDHSGQFARAHGGY